MGIVSFRLPNLISLGGVDLTDEGRQPLEEQLDQREIKVMLASGKNVKFIKGEKRKWVITYKNVPMDATVTVDGHGARNEIRLIAYSTTPQAFTLHDGKNQTEFYTVWISEYNEQLSMRRSDTFYYDITIGVEEVG